MPAASCHLLLITWDFHSRRRGGPTRQGQPVDLGVVAHIHGKAWMKIETPDAGRVWMPDGELAERVRKGLPFRGGAHRGPGF